MVITLDEFIAEIENTFSNFAETGDIDRISIKGWVISCLREFGKNICDQREAILEVSNSQVNLPATFKSLILALKLKTEGYNIIGNPERAKESFIYRQRIENPGYFDWITNEFITNCDSKVITEKIVMNGEQAEFYYTPEWLSIVKGFKKDSLDVNCLNLNPAIRNSYPHQISINNRTLQTNFSSGKIYVQYNSLPVSDEDGEVVIPEISTGDLYKYIENTVKLKIAENLIINGKNPQGITQLVSMWQQQSIPLRNAAKSECNWSGLSKDWHKIYKNKLQREMNSFNLPKY